MKMLACLVGLILLAPPVAAADSAGTAAYKRGDYVTAAREWRGIADQGNFYIQYNLGIMYSKGLGVQQDYAAAVSWYRKAADQGYAEAQFNLGAMYSEGQGIPQDYVAAVNWYRKAADQGKSEAQSNLGVMYAEGKGVPQDYIQAHKWYNLAAATGLKAAIQNRDNLAKVMTPAQVAEAQKLASEWFANRAGK